MDGACSFAYDFKPVYDVTFIIFHLYDYYGHDGYPSYLWFNVLSLFNFVDMYVHF